MCDTSEATHPNNVIATIFPGNSVKMRGGALALDILWNAALVASDEDWDAQYLALIYAIKAAA